MVDGHAGDLPFGEVFDIPRLSSLIRSPVLEWRDIKTDQEPVTETLGCWAIWNAQQSYELTPREGWFPRNSGLGIFRFTPLFIYLSSLTRFPPDVSFTQAPAWIKALPDHEHDKTARFWDLARLSFPDARREWLNSGYYIQQVPSPFLEVIEDPDQQMLCMDYLYYVGANTVCRCCRNSFHLPSNPPPLPTGRRI